MPYYRKKPIIIEAHQYHGNGKLVKGICDSQSCYVKGNIQPHVHTIHQATRFDGSDNSIVNLAAGDYVIPEPDGIHFYPCKADVFKATYDEVKSDYPPDEKDSAD